ncbi:PadR family transcriptional regulator [Mycolicibacterium sp. jd]|uniref:PadR family transcriptional regulator n=1 Tax=unclassified Mycolicibacterium TaxID=2636767 RepID=UPI00351B647D
MALRDAVLAALLEGEASGYDLAKRFDRSVANFWTATPQQLYRELDAMAAEGLIEARVVPQQRRPTKRLYSLTPAGYEHIRSFTRQQPKPIAIRDDLLVMVQALDAGDPTTIRDAIAKQIDWATPKLATLERLRTRMLGDSSEQQYLTQTESLGPYLTLLRGIAFEQENIRWAEHALTIIDRRFPHLHGEACCTDR